MRDLAGALQNDDRNHTRGPLLADRAQGDDPANEIRRGRSDVASGLDSLAERSQRRDQWQS